MPSLPTVAVPGQPLASVTEYLPGSGVHIRSDGQLCATIVGLVQVSHKSSSAAALSSSPSSQPSTTKETEQTTITTSASLPILNISNSLLTPQTPQPPLPQVASHVLARITRTTSRQASASIIAINDTVTIDEYPAVIRVQDIRATEKDKVRVGKSFKPGDIVRAQVISLGDREGYYLSTAGNYLGVVLGWSEEGSLLYPKSWKEMVCSRTGNAEERKVAKPL